MTERDKSSVKAEWEKFPSWNEKRYEEEKKKYAREIDTMKNKIKIKAQLGKEHMKKRQATMSPKGMLGIYIEQGRIQSTIHPSPILWKSQSGRR